jgi:hypothetical protein
MRGIAQEQLVSLDLLRDNPHTVAIDQPADVDNKLRKTPERGVEPKDWAHMARMWYVSCVHPLKQLASMDAGGMRSFSKSARMDNSLPKSERRSSIC